MAKWSNYRHYEERERAPVASPEAAPAPPPAPRMIKVRRNGAIAYGGPTEAEIYEDAFPSWALNGWTKVEA